MNWCSIITLILGRASNSSSGSESGPVRKKQKIVVDSKGDGSQSGSADDSTQVSEDKGKGKRKKPATNKATGAKKERKSRKKKEKRSKLNDIPHTEEEDAELQNEIRPSAGIPLTKEQQIIQNSLEETKLYEVGGITMDPAKMLSPPPKFASRALYSHHVERLQAHFLSLGVFQMPKAMLIVCEKVCVF